jgi:hypothetical protein
MNDQTITDSRPAQDRTIDSDTDLVTGRLRYVLPDGPSISVDREANTSYSASRLGLIPRLQRPLPVVEPQDDPKIAYKKSTFKIPEATVARLKAYATVTEQYQYNVVSDALRQYLDRLVSSMGYEERGQMVDLTRQFLDEGRDEAEEEDKAQRLSSPSGSRNDVQQVETPSDVEPAASHSPHWLSMLRRIGQVGRS